MESMKLSKREARKLGGECVAEPSGGPEYPRGLEINLEKEQFEKLGMSIGDLSVGDKVNTNAVARIKSLSMREDVDDYYEGVGLQIIKMEVED